MVLDPEQQRLWEEARGYAVAEILAKYQGELKEAQCKHFSRLTQRAADGATCACPRVDGVVYHVVGCWVGFLESPRR